MDLMEQYGYALRETCAYPGGAKSEYYTDGETAVIIDYDICSLSEGQQIFPYSLMTEKQNSYMKTYKRVFRFLKEDADDIADCISGFHEDADFMLHTADRSDSADASPLEFLFEKSFAGVYGMGSLKYLQKEFCVSDFEGNNYFLDYYIRTDRGGIAVEENGVSYHHPQVIGTERYRKQLQKQNTCTGWGIRLYRFSTEDCRFEGRIDDEIREYLGHDCTGFEAGSLTVNRDVVLYEHQETCLSEIVKARAAGKSAFLVVLPTASGKSKIAEEDIRRFAYTQRPQDHPFRFLILAPNTAITEDWQNRIRKSLSDLQDAAEIRTFAYMTRNYVNCERDAYDYIVVDEAHHAVAPVLRRVIQYFSPRFMLGLTATDERPDRKRLETVFGSYQTTLSLQEAMEKKIIAQARVYRVETNVDLSSVRINGREYVSADLEKSIRVTSRNELIADVLETYFTEGKAGRRQGIIFCVNTRHTREMAEILNRRGISAKAYSSREKSPEKIMDAFRNGKIRFLCACSMISEGWDCPELGILVMARPTLSKVLYLQQVGRGLRKTDRKKDVFVIDVVDEYGAMAQPCSMHAVFSNPYYVPFAPVTQRTFRPGELIEVDGICERIERITELDTESFEDKYGTWLSTEQLAREFFVSTATVNSWIRKGKITPSASLPFGSRKIHLFSPEDAEIIRKQQGLKVHDDTTVHQDFFDFLAERDYTLSYKMPFLLSFLDCMNDIGEASIDSVLEGYRIFYENRLKQGLPADRSTCPYTETFLRDRKKLRENMLTNPFEKFERKRFMYYSKELGMLALNHALLDSLSESDFARIRAQMAEDLRDYYRKLDGKGR